MPDENMMGTDVQTTLENLEDYSLDNHITRIQNYNTILNVLEKDEDIDGEVIKRLLDVCVHDATILKYTAAVIKIILAILSKVKMGKYDPAPDLVPSALKVMTVIKTIALVNKVDNLMIVCHETLLSYPDDTLVAVVEEHEQVLEIFNLYCQLRVPIQYRLQACNLLHKLLVILPLENKKVFVGKGVSVWFSKIIPTVMTLMTPSGPVNLVGLEVLEMLTDVLVHIDYTDNPHWQTMLECICNTKQYPAMMKNLLHAGNSVWYRLWIVFIRLLKHKITQPLTSVGTPINSMLPVVESAFKLDVENRCKAFECWTVLIDSFSIETNESNINKRIKLLIIPLRSNNAKAEETALAKFKCWWHLITKFQNKMDKFLDLVLVSFLNFCFGRYNATDKSLVVPGLLSVNVKKQCNQAIVDMVGHVNCEGCTDLPKLKGKIINTKHLVDNWNHWIYSLTSVIMKSVHNGHGLTKQQMTCLWKSYLMTIGELPENNIRKDLFAEILSIVEHLVQECKSNNQFIDVAFNVLILSLFAEDTKIKQLFKSEDDPNDPITRIVKIILDPCLYEYYLSLPSRELATKLKTVTKLIVDEGVCTPKHIVDCILVGLPANNFGLTFWDALAESVCESEYKCSLVIHNMLLWPLNSIQLFSEVKTAAMTWYTTYNLMYPKLNKTDIDKEITEILFSTLATSSSTVYFELCVILGVLKHSVIESNCMEYEKQMNLLLNLTKSIDNYENFEPMFPILVDRIVAIMSTVSANENDTVAALILVCMKNVLHILTQACKQQTNVDHLMILIGSLLKPLEILFAVDSYLKLIPAMTYHLLSCSRMLSEHLSTRIVYLSVMKTILIKTKTSDANYIKIKSLINDIENRKLKTDPPNENVDKNAFTTPQTKEVPKRPKKKEANIVNTVVENGEEYVVVKSNWKFNPRKLTENQKEKLQRKREDIPALYQDLSQSQDEFKLVSWKTDSQDTTSSSRSESKTSKSGTNATDAEFLKNLPSTNVVPKILENFFSEKEKKDARESLPKDNLSKIEASTPSTKNAKSPRMALKDRVFRNVRNLIENSALQKENKDLFEDPNKTDNNLKTPTNTKNNTIANIVNSAPPLLSADRPSRVKRKPKKFEDLELLTSKRGRNSLHDVHSDTAEQHSDEALPSKNDANKNGNDFIEISSSAENQEGNSCNNLQQSHDFVSKIDITNSNENKTDDISEGVTTKCKEKAISCSESDIVMTDNDKVEKSTEQSNVTKSKDGREVTVDTVTNDLIETISTPKVSGHINEASTPMLSKTGVEVSTLVTYKDVKEVATPNSAKPDNEVSTPVTSKDLNEMVTPTVCQNLKVISTPKSSNVKEVSAVKLTEINKEVSIPMVSNDIEVSIAPKTAVEASTPRSSRVCKEVLTPPLSKDLKEMTTPKSSTDGMKVSTPRTCRNNKGVSTSKTSKDKEVLNPRTPTATEETLIHKASEDLQEISNHKQSKQLSTINTSKEVKEGSTLKQAKECKEISTPKQSPKGDDQKSTAKKNTDKKSKIEKELAIDMVEGHPYLKMQSQKRLTRKTVESATIGRRKTIAEKLNKLKIDGISTPKGDKKSREKNKESESISTSSVVVDESQERDSELKDQSSFSDDLPYSDDVIESSQDSTVTTISVKSSRKTPKKVPVVCVEKLISPTNNISDGNISQSILDCVSRVRISPSDNHESKDDSVLPLNKTALEDKTQDDLTENMDTEPLDGKNVSDDVLIINDDVPALTIAIENSIIGPETQEIAEAGTQPTYPKEFMDIDETPDNIVEPSEMPPAKVLDTSVPETCIIENEIQAVAKDYPVVSKTMDLNNSVSITAISLSNAACTDVEQCSGVSSPFKDEAQRQQDFLNNTIEISPIKTMSPDRNKTPSPDTSGDYVVITLSSPVQSNGEPFEKCGSPEVFTEDKVSPDKRDQSPPRVEISVTSTSPSSSLSLKKNRPQVRSGGRAAQMLGLCVPDKVQAIVNPERNESEEVKKCNATNTPARRNLRILYTSVSDNTESTNETYDSEHFLKFRRSLPAVDSSPSGPILKRKLAEITDDATISPASKRKRVSFHDPPVSTTISVQKYIEPGGVRSPQNSAHKRLERQMRQHTPLKSPKRLDNVFKLDTVLTKTVESFSEDGVITIPDDTQAFSLDETPEVEIVRASELNDTDPICPELLDCKDPIENIAGELSSPAMKSLLIKELEGKIETVGDLAKMTELEVNRLCIKAPKVKVAKKVLIDYASKKTEKPECEITVTLDVAEFDVPMIESEIKAINIEVQTDKNMSMEMEVQTMDIPTRISSVQTEVVPTTHTSIQTDESGCKSTADIIKSCLSEKPDFVQLLGEHLEESSILQISEQLPLNTVTNLLMKKITPTDTKDVLNKILEQECSSSNDRSKEMSFITDYLSGRFDTKFLVLLCSKLLKVVHDKPA